MDQFSRRIIGFGVQAVVVDGVALFRMFNRAISGQGLPVRLSLDHDPLFQFQRWQANLRILGIADCNRFWNRQADRSSAVDRQNAIHGL
jgi:hypothetical protein